MMYGETFLFVFFSNELNDLLWLLRSVSLLVCLFILRLNILVNNFLTFPMYNQYFRKLMYVAQGHNTVPPVGVEPERFM